jgi:cellulose biosynthesis protein BcsQ
MVESKKSLHQEMMEKIESGGHNVLRTRIPYRSDIERMGVYREPVTAFLPQSDSARIYADLWEEIRGITGKGGAEG